MSIRSHAERKKLEAIGRIVRLTLDEMSAAVRPGVTTAELDTVAAMVLAREGAESSPPKVYGFPGTACISVNDEAIHGIPGRRKIEEGDLVKLDVTAEKDGFVADAAVTVRAGKTSGAAEALARCAESAFRQALKLAQVGNRVYEIGRCGAGSAALRVQRDQGIMRSWRGQDHSRRAASAELFRSALPD
jgi:methionyl aminopeptidase